MSARQIATWFQGHRIAATTPAECLRVRERLEVETAIDVGEVLKRARTIEAEEWLVIEEAS